MKGSLPKKIGPYREPNVERDQSQSPGPIWELNVKRDHSRSYSLKYGSRSPRVTSAWALILMMGAEARFVKCNKSRSFLLLFLELNVKHNHSLSCNPRWELNVRLDLSHNPSPRNGSWGLRVTSTCTLVLIMGILVRFVKCVQGWSPGSLELESYFRVEVEDIYPKWSLTW